MRSKEAEAQAKYQAKIRASNDLVHKLVVLKQSWHFQKARAGKRGIEFLLTFEEWLKIWEDSGHIHERGRLKHQYCMARNGDCGPYAVGNVSIITMEENTRRQTHPWLGRKATASHKAKLSAGMMGNNKGFRRQPIEMVQQ